MNLSVGIVGLPNVGKSTLFNALLKKQVANVANYPFCTIDPNIGVIEVPDARLPVLAKIVKTDKIVPAIVEFYDIAGLVKGASVGEGLGNKFLSHIREVATIVHVVRLFENNEIIHIANKIDPADDIKTIETELILADLATVTKQTEPRMNAAKEELLIYEVVKKVKAELDRGIPLRKAGLTAEQLQLVHHLNFLTVKPVIFAFNVSERQLEDGKNTNEKIEAVLNSIGENSPYLPFCAKLENEVLALNAVEQKEYLNQYNLPETGLNRLVKLAYKTLNLISFLTAGVIEAKAWTIKNGTFASQAAGVIHTDFEKNFIKAEVIPFEEFVKTGGWVGAREQGKTQIVGRNYIMKDGEVVDFKIGV